LLQASNILSAVFEKRLKVLYSSSIKSAKRLVSRNLVKSGQYYYNKFLIESHLFDIHNFRANKDQKSNSEEIELNLNIAFIVHKLKIYSHILGHNKHRDFHYNTIFTNEVMEHVGKNDYSAYPAVQIYYKTCLLLNQEQKEDKSYFNLKSLVNNNIEIFPPEEAQDLYHILSNYCIRRIHSGAQNFYRELFDIYKRRIDQDLLVINNTLEPLDYKNIVLLGLRLTEFDWTDNFIEVYSHYIPNEHRSNAYSFNRARYFFYKKEYDKALPLLAQVESIWRARLCFSQPITKRMSMMFLSVLWTRSERFLIETRNVSPLIV